MMGNETQVLFNVGETLFTARWTGQYIIDAGQHLNVTLSADDFHFFDGRRVRSSVLPSTSRALPPKLHKEAAP